MNSELKKIKEWCDINIKAFDKSKENQFHDYKTPKEKEYEY